MAKIVSNLTGDLRKGVFYHFEVMYEDVPYDKPTSEWIVVPRTPTNDTLIDTDQPYYLHLEDDPREADCIEIKDCQANPNHVTLRYYRKLHANLAGGVRVGHFIPTVPRCFVSVAEDMQGRLNSLNAKGTRLDPIAIGGGPHELKERGLELWHFQFVGRARMRPPKFVDAPNLCPHCGQGKIACESCGRLIPLCENCGQEMHVIDYKHMGSSDKRIPIDSHFETVIEGKTWDGSDLVQRCYASKRFIDWLLRIHAAPFYAEPVYFCVDGMSDQQKKWFDDLQKPFEA